MSGALHIRVASLAERDALRALQTRASLRNVGDRDALLQHPDAIDVPPEQILARQVFVAERDGVVVGFAAVVPREDGDAELDALFVEPALWRQGIARALLEHGVALARMQGAKALHVIGNPHAAAFYRGCGFVGEGTFKTRFGQGYLMRRDISAA